MHRGCGCIGHPAFPTPSVGREIYATTRAHLAAGSRSCVCNPVTVIASQRVARRMTGFAKPSIEAQRKHGLLPPSLLELRRTGRRFAPRNDGSATELASMELSVRWRSNCFAHNV